MYAIVTTGGKQYKVAKDDVIEVEKLDAAAGEQVDLDVILVSEDGKVTTDEDALAKVKVTAEVLEQFKGEKKIVFKFKKRKGYKKLNGHRQSLTRLRITGVGDDVAKPGKSAAKAEDVKAQSKPAAKKAQTADDEASTESAPAAKKPAAKKPAAKKPAEDKADKDDAAE